MLKLQFDWYITALNLFPVVCCYRWQGWKWIEAQFFQVLMLCSQWSPKNYYG